LQPSAARRSLPRPHSLIHTPSTDTDRSSAPQHIQLLSAVVQESTTSTATRGCSIRGKTRHAEDGVCRRLLPCRMPSKLVATGEREQWREANLGRPLSLPDLPTHCSGRLCGQMLAAQHSRHCVVDTQMCHPSHPRPLSTHPTHVS